MRSRARIFVIAVMDGGSNRFAADLGAPQPASSSDPLSASPDPTQGEG